MRRLSESKILSLQTTVRIARRILQLYQAHGKDLLSFSFSGNHNLIHSMPHYQKLYSALSKSTALRLFLDTDERLVWMDSNSWHDGGEVLYRLKAAHVNKLCKRAAAIYWQCE